jgi:hypothetical protein
MTQIIQGAETPDEPTKVEAAPAEEPKGAPVQELTKEEVERFIMRRHAFTGGKLSREVRKHLSPEEIDLILEARRQVRQFPTVRKLRKSLGIDSGRQWRKFRKAMQRQGTKVTDIVARQIAELEAARQKEAAKRGEAAA